MILGTAPLRIEIFWRINFPLWKQVHRPYLDPKSMTPHAKGATELFRIFFVHYLGPGEPFSKSGRAQEEVRPKKSTRNGFLSKLFPHFWPSISSSIRNSSSREPVFWSFLTNTEWDQALPSHVFGKLFLINELIEGQKCGNSFDRNPFPVLFSAQPLLEPTHSSKTARQGQDSGRKKFWQVLLFLWPN